MDYVHEDLGLMNRELEKWQSDARKSTDQLEVEKEKTEAEMAPLRMELTEADEKVSKRSLLLAERTTVTNVTPFLLPEHSRRPDNNETACC